MRVLIGLNAIDRWAWMLLDEHGHLLASGDDYYEAALAQEHGVEEMKRRAKSRDSIR